MISGETRDFPYLFRVRQSPTSATTEMVRQMLNRLSNGLPKLEVFGLTSRMRQAADSTPMNLAE